MNWLVEAVFRPSGNRYYTIKKAHTARLISEVAISAAIGGLIGFYSFGWAGLFTCVLVAIPIALVLDHIYDKITWRIYQDLGFKRLEPTQTEAQLLESAKKEAINKN